MIRAGVIKYINSIPFSAGLETSADLLFDTPRNLVDLFLAGECDIAFIPTIAYLRHPKRFVLVDGVSISSFGPTRSVFLVYTGKITTLRYITASEDSVTSNTVTQQILLRHYGVETVLMRDENPEKGSARIIIGDDALNYKCALDESLLDIGSAWFDMTGLPIVYAVCVAHTHETAVTASQMLTAKRDQNLVNLQAVLCRMQQSDHYEYLMGLDYSFTDKHAAALVLMTEMLTEDENR